MERQAFGRREYFWFATILVISSPLLFTLCVAMWRTPYPISETVSLLVDYVDASPLSFFDPTTRSWYRPLYHLTWWGLGGGTGLLDGALFWFKWLEIAAVALLATLFIWCLRPRRLIEGAAATFAVGVLVGTPGFRENLEIPLLMTLVGMPIALLVWMLLERDHRLWHGPVIVALMLIAIGFKEQGLIIAPLVVAAWWMGARGATRGTTAAVVATAAAYLAMRIATSSEWRPFEQDVGLGFDRLSAGEASDRFGAFPFWMYLYSAASTAANILFSEPTDGRFTIVWNLTHGEFTTRDITHLTSSVALTALIAWWGFRSLKADAARGWSAESRLFIATALAIAASGALGFNYSRDRLGGMAVVFYAMAACFAMRAAAERAMHASQARVVTVTVALVLLGGAWHIRAVGTIEEVRSKAARNRREWIVDMQERRTQFAREPHYLRILEAMAEQGLAPLQRDDAAPAGSMADAIVQGEVERAYAFIRAGQDPNQPIPFRHPDITGDRHIMVSPLLLAVASQSENAVSMLLSFGARMELPGNRMALCLAKQVGDEEVTDIIVRYGGPVSNLECPESGVGPDPPLLAFVE